MDLKAPQHTIGQLWQEHSKRISVQYSSYAALDVGSPSTESSHFCWRGITFRFSKQTWLEIPVQTPKRRSSRSTRGDGCVSQLSPRLMVFYASRCSRGWPARGLCFRFTITSDKSFGPCCRITALLTQAAAADHVGRHRPQLPLGLDVLQQPLVEAGRPRWVWLELAGRDLMGKTKMWDGKPGRVWIHCAAANKYWCFFISASK